MHRGLLFGIPGGWFMCGVLGAWIASSKGRGGCFWLALCWVTGPIGLILAAVVSPVGRD